MKCIGILRLVYCNLNDESQKQSEISLNGFLKAFPKILELDFILIFENREAICSHSFIQSKTHFLSVRATQSNMSYFLHREKH